MPYKEKTDEDLKRYFTIGEIADSLGIFTSTLRYWEKEFDWLRPKYGKKGHRQYTPADKLKATEIHYLMHVCGMTTDGVRQAREKGYFAELLQIFDDWRDDFKWDILK